MMLHDETLIVVLHQLESQGVALDGELHGLPDVPRLHDDLVPVQLGDVPLYLPGNARLGRQAGVVLLVVGGHPIPVVHKAHVAVSSQGEAQQRPAVFKILPRRFDLKNSSAMVTWMSDK